MYVAPLLTLLDLTGSYPLQSARIVNPLYFALGVVLLTALVVDLLWTTLWVDGGSGPLSARLSNWTWRGVRRVASSYPRFLSLAGPLLLTLTLSMWIGLLWAGWTFVFAGGEYTLIDTRNGGPADWSGRLYFVAYSMFTMGNGDFTPNGDIWQIATSLTTASGMLVATLGVSYILSVLGAVSDKRAFANGVTGLGMRSEAFVQSGWDGEDFDDLDLLLNTLSSDLNMLAEQHKSYPILHYYHSESDTEASVIAVTILADATFLLESAVPDDVEPNGALMESTRSSVDDYLQTLTTAFTQPADESPPPPDLDCLRNAEIPTVDEREFADALADREESRRKLYGAIKADAWYWPSGNDDQ